MKKNLLILSSVLLLSSCAANSGGSALSSETEKSSETTSSLQSSSQQSQDNTSSADSDLVSLPALHVILYTKQITDTSAVDSFKSAFEEYVKGKGYSIANLTYDYVGSGKVTTLNSELQAFEEANYPGDVVLGAKAVAAADAPWFNETYEVYKVGENNFEFDFGGNTARRIWTRKTPIHAEATQVLVDYCLSLVAVA